MRSISEARRAQPVPWARHTPIALVATCVFASLSGIVSGVDDRGSDDLSSDLMQVSCQVLNASRWGGA